MTTLAPLAGETSADAPPASADGPANPVLAIALVDVAGIVAQLDCIETMLRDLLGVANNLNDSAGQAMAQLTGGGLSSVLGALMGRKG